MAEHAGPPPLATLRRNYTPAFLAHLAHHDEATLRTAYELGREAMADGVSMLDLVQIHHSVFFEVVSTVRNVDEIPEMLESATTFLVESLAPFEMTRHLPR